LGGIINYFDESGINIYRRQVMECLHAIVHIECLLSWCTSCRVLICRSRFISHAIQNSLHKQQCLQVQLGHVHINAFKIFFVYKPSSIWAVHTAYRTVYIMSSLTVGKGPYFFQKEPSFWISGYRPEILLFDCGK